VSIISTKPAAVDVRSILGKNPSDPRLEDLYSVDKQIGKGAFGVVRLGHNKATADPVAVKSISKAKLTCKEDIQDVQAEIAIMNLVAGHGNVVMLQVCG
jgi:calcium-dependent protein kinase